MVRGKKGTRKTKRRITRRLGIKNARKYAQWMKILKRRDRGNWSNKKKIVKSGRLNQNYRKSGGKTRF